jgi:molybdate transport system substrate-binding protein
MQAAVTALAAEPAPAADIVFEPMGALKARLAGGETADVLVLAASAIDALVATGAALAGSRTAIASAAIGVAAREDLGAPPGIATADAFAAALKGARAIALSDPAVGGSAGVYLRDLFERIGLAETVAARSLYRHSGAAAGDAVGRGEADLALTFIPELMQARGIRILGPLPPPHAHATAYVAGVATHSVLQERAHAFIAALTGPRAAPAWTAAGFDPAPAG